MPFLFGKGRRGPTYAERRKLPVTPTPPQEGPGTELKKLLEKAGILPNGTCSCNAMAARMNREGVDWCREHLNEILDFMEKEAKRRKLPFWRAGATLLVRVAIRRVKA